MRGYILFLAIALSPLVAHADASTSLNVPPSSSAAQLRTNLGLGTMATQNADMLAATGGTATGLTAMSSSYIGNMPTYRSPIPSRDVTGGVASPSAYLSLTTRGKLSSPNNAPAVLSVFQRDFTDKTIGGGWPTMEISYNAMGGIGFGHALHVFCGTKAAIGRSPAGNFSTCAQVRTGPQHNAGGTSMTDPFGQNNAQNNLAILEKGAKWWVVNGIYENNMAVRYNASALMQHGGQIARLDEDWGNVGGGARPNQTYGRFAMWWDSQTPGYDGTDAGSALATAGNNLPAYKSHLLLGGSTQEWLGDSTTSFVEVFPQTAPNRNSCTQAKNPNCPHTIVPGAPIRPQILGDGFKWGNIHFTNEAWRTPGFVIKGSGEIHVGNGVIAPSAGGVTIDAIGSYVVAAAYASADRGGHQVGEYIYGTSNDGTVPGAILKITGVDHNGGISGLSVVDPGYSPNPASHNNAAGTQVFSGGGRVWVNLTWADATDGAAPTIALAPSAGRVKIGAGNSLVTIAGGGVVTTGAITANGGIQVENKGANGGYGSIGNEGGTNLAFRNHDGAVAAYYDMNQAAPQFYFNGTTQFNGPVKLKAYTAGTLPSCNTATQDTIAVVTDASAPAYNTAVAGGGAVRIRVYCDGSDWKT